MTFLAKIGHALGLVDYKDYCTIQKNPKTGRWTIYDTDGLSITDYSRRRDAFRGAARNGLTVI